MAWFAHARLRSDRSRPRYFRTKLRTELLEDRSMLTLLGAQLFPADNPWNQRITTAPVAANSAAIMDNIIRRAGDGRLHPDFGQDSNTAGDLYGIPYNVVHGNSVPRVSVVIDAYDDESDLIPAPIPANAVIEGDFQNGPRAGVDERGDSHLIVFDVDNNVLYEFFRASRPSENSDGRWHADQESVWDSKTNTFRRLGDTSADAAGLPILTGLARPDEGLPVAQGGQGVINHAIRMTLQNAIILDQFIYPASHTANPGNDNAGIQPPMGARFRLKASVDISQLNPQSRIIAQAMKDYGLIIADNGSNFFFTGASASVDGNNQQALSWSDSDIQDSTRGLKSLRFSSFEVVDLTPIVTGLSAASGPAGTSLTITGQNFSGAAGKLKVIFGNTAATSVTVVDDTHVTAVVPPGSGTVDVRVQSGATTGANGDNYKSPIFGYGISAVTAAARFTYGSPQVSVVGRWLFYNGSSYDDPDGSGPLNGNGYDLTLDNGAIDPDKTPLRLGGAQSASANFDNITGWRHGINGIMIDLSPNPLRAAALSASDFKFKVGNDQDPSGWDDAPAPAEIHFESRGAGLNDRITILWSNATAPLNTWLQVTVLSEAHGGHAGLPEDDVFYWGSKPGAVGLAHASLGFGDPSKFRTNGIDVGAIIQRTPTESASQPVNNNFDLTKDKRVDGLDVSLAINGSNIGVNPDLVRLTISGPSALLLTPDGGALAFPAAANTNPVRGAALFESLATADSPDGNGDRLIPPASARELLQAVAVALSEPLEVTGMCSLDAQALLPTPILEGPGLPDSAEDLTILLGDDLLAVLMTDADNGRD